MSLSVDVTIRGPLFDKKIDQVVKDAIVSEALDKINERLSRKGTQGSGGRGLGVKRNVVTTNRREMEVTSRSTLVYPRTKGTAWTRKNVGIVKAMAPRVVRKVGRRIVEELG